MTYFSKHLLFVYLVDLHCEYFWLGFKKQRAFCSAITDIAYSNAFDLLGIDEPNGFDYLGEVESNLYVEIENLSVQDMSLCYWQVTVGNVQMVSS